MLHNDQNLVVESNNAGKLTFRISTAKTIFMIGEPILCTMQLVNTGAVPLTVNGRLLVNWEKDPHEVLFRIQNQAQQVLPFDAFVNAGPLKEIHFRTLPPGEAIVRQYDLSVGYLRYSGRYSVMAIYENLSEPSSSTAPLWKGRLDSNVLELEVF